VDHGFRPESKAEARFVADLCDQIGVRHEILTLDAPREGNVSDWARTERYKRLRAWAKTRGIEALATAHHADDQLETLLMRLNRGSGVGGLAGVRERNHGLIRPLLGWRKAELEAVVAECGIVAVDDPTNRDDRYDRARMRKALRGVEWLDPIAVSRSAAALAEADDALAWSAQALFDEYAMGDATELSFAAPQLPRELGRRIALHCLRAVNPEADPRGAALDRLLTALQNNGVMTISGVKCCGGRVWQFSPEPPRRTN
jgi:tRNA(Ile)-lysidine synthase